MTEAAILHQAQGIDRGSARGDGVGVDRHHVGESGLGRILSFGQNAHHGIAPGKDTEQTPSFVGYQYGTNPAIAHALTGILHRSAGG
jgi:hypothetical protein